MGNCNCNKGNNRKINTPWLADKNEISLQGKKIDILIIDTTARNTRDSITNVPAYDNTDK